MQTIIRKIVGDPQQKLIKHFQPSVDAINALESQFESQSDEDLVSNTEKFRKRLQNGETLDDILPEAFSVVRECSKRVLKMRHFDVQLIGGMVLHTGCIAEMKTGEGKTLMSTLPAYLNALEGKGVYIVTVNDYLAKRDSEWMAQIFNYLGLSVGLIQNNMSPQDRLEAYKADITYGTNNEFGFDYLRDNLAWDLDQCSQTRRHYAIIDEVDSILIDEARTPLIISGPIEDSTSKYLKLSMVVKTLKNEIDFTLEEKHKNVVLTDSGVDKLEKELNVENIYTVENMDIAHMAVQCLRAIHLYKKDVDYVVKNGEIYIVDEFTGRLMEGRRYSDGLHQSIEAIEGLKIREESQTLASITFQNYFRMFDKLAGMTGTALTEASEFENIYSLSVSPIPTNKPMIREDKSDVVYKTKDEKYKAIVNDIAKLNKEGKPVLVGTIAIETSELLSRMLTKKGVIHTVLNAKQHEKEADIISSAGKKGAVTIATNMAGRGTDIVLGEGVVSCGGLHVIGSERHESRRIDNQLRGRSGRQGDPGWSRFYVSLDDELMRLFGSDRIARVMDRLGVPSDTPIEHGLISKSIEKAQSKVEKYHFGMRKQILQYDDVMNKQRESIYGIRRRMMELKKVEELTKEIIRDLVSTILSEVEAEKTKGISISCVDQLKAIFPIENISSYKGKKYNEVIKSEIIDLCHSFYKSRRDEYPAGLFDEVVTKRVFMMNLDRKWVDHQSNMDVLREGIGLRAYGQRDPLIEYKREAFDLFRSLLFDIYQESWQLINRAALVSEDEKSLKKPQEMSLNMSGNNKKLEDETPKVSEKTGRNDPCHCGSGKKYKKCHGS
ncbi:preprotein translocase subunit SecA [Candidatus Marinamargulisbacteria bacterium SCGC AAA071-K20]|nr:preprotein translocase subunit SecA [Candidatus Marinamargulisbacteria bacterium SCGC AAA071-K20]